MGAFRPRQAGRITYPMTGASRNDVISAAAQAMSTAVAEGESAAESALDDADTDVTTYAEEIPDRYR